MNEFIIDVNEQNLNEILQLSQQRPLVLNFYAPSHLESSEFLTLLERVANQYQGQFVLAKVNCETEQMIVAQFRLQTLPTTYLFKQAQAVDAFQTTVDEETLKQHLSLILPSEQDIKFQQGIELLQAENYSLALPLLKQAWELSQMKNTEIGLAYASAYIGLKQTKAAQEVLNQIPLQDRDSYWQGLNDQIDLLIQAADTPEIQQLQQEFNINPSPEIAIQLAVQLQQASRNEEALELLFNILKQDLNCQNGEVKQQFLAILSAIGNTDSVANKYRRLLYSLLY